MLVVSVKRFDVHEKIPRPIAIPEIWQIPLPETTEALLTEQTHADYVLNAHITHLGDDRDNGINERVLGNILFSNGNFSYAFECVHFRALHLSG